MATRAGVGFPQVDFLAPAAPMTEAAAKANANRPQLMATRDGLNARSGRGTVRLGSLVPTTLLDGHAKAFACNVSINHAYWLKIAVKQAARLS